MLQTGNCRAIIKYDRIGGQGIPPYVTEIMPEVHVHVRVQATGEYMSCGQSASRAAVAFCLFSFLFFPRGTMTLTNI